MHEFGQRAGCPVHLSKFSVLADVLPLVEAVALAGPLPQETQAAPRPHG